MQSNILYVSTAKGWRGGEQQLAHLITTGRTLFPSIQIKVACLANEAFAEFCKAQSIPFEPIANNQLIAAKQVKQICLRDAIQMIHTNDSHAHTIAVLAGSLFGNKSKIVVHRRVDFVNQGILSKWKYNYKKIVAYLPISEEIKKILKTIVSPKHYNKIEKIYSTVELNSIQKSSVVPIREKLNLPKDSKIIGNISALVDHKDYETFLKVAKTIVSTDTTYHFIILGKGNLEEQLKQYSKSLNIETNVHFLGFQRNPISYLKSFDVFLMTSKTEGLGSSVLQAFAAGIPVVSTNGGGLKEIVLHQKTGLITDVGNDEKLASLVKETIQNPTATNQRVEQAKILIETQFTVEHMVNKTYSIYQKILNID